VLGMYFVKVLDSVKYSSGLPVGLQLLFWSTTTLLQVALFSQSFFGEGIDELYSNVIGNKS
jgi:hypothetical protein